MQGLIVLSLCNTYSIPSVFLYANSLRGRGIFRRFPTFPDLGRLKKVCDLADACGGDQTEVTIMEGSATGGLPS